MIFERSLHQQAVAEVAAALREERRDEAYAESLAAIAEDYDVPMEHVIRWIHSLEMTAPLSLHELRGLMVDYALERAAS